MEQAFRRVQNQLRRLSRCVAELRGGSTKDSLSAGAIAASELSSGKNFMDSLISVFRTLLDEMAHLLRSLRFIHDASNVILLGPPWGGKTH